ncbi:universal stress protein [Pseudonocardia kujensis]|uniref:universal stress protein n=1 Tax=Pseudonocardia kujensis TaxID=1128675 RepID=UPI001E4A5B64|nr:universal stress protein [Pseudonocardia kujensis]MCE0767634.1 universal stress protein [Pseudonocardia kujensis]
MDLTTRAVVVGVDGSDTALAAVRWAAAEAERRGAPLRIVAAVVWRTYRPRVLALAAEYERQVLTRGAEQDLQAAAEVARQVTPELVVTTEVRGGGAPAVLREESGTALLVVVGSRGRGGFPGLLLGSVAVAVAAQAVAPVVVVRGEGASPDAAAPIVVGVEDGPDGKAALRFAFDEAARRRAPLVAVRAWGDPVHDLYRVSFVDWNAVETGERQLLDECLATWPAEYPEVSVERILLHDTPAAALVARSRGAGLVVVGSRGRGTVRGALLGSVSQAVLHHAAAPVAVVGPEAGGQRSSSPRERDEGPAG